MTTDELVKTAEHHDVINNEGDDGYNPYRAEIASRGATASERTEDDIVREIEIAESIIAHESGTYDQDKVDTLRLELDEFRANRESAFRAEWPRETTQQRKAAWNEIATKLNPGRKLTTGEMREYMAAVEAEAGFKLADLKKAIAMHK